MDVAQNYAKYKHWELFQLLRQMKFFSCQTLVFTKLSLFDIEPTAMVSETIYAMF